MKKFYHLTLLLALTILLAASCKGPKPLAGIFDRELQKGKDSSGTVFVVKKNG